MKYGRVLSRPSAEGTGGSWSVPPAAGYCHQALHYRGRDDLLGCVVPFVRAGAAGGEPVLVMLPGASLAHLRAVLGGDIPGVELADMDDVGANPARIIPAWRAFIDRHAGAGPLRGVGEPISAAHPQDRVTESLLHENLLNVAIEATTALWLLCPYDTSALDPRVVRHSLRNHAFVYDGGPPRPSDAFLGRRALGRPASAPLDPAPPTARQLVVDQASLLARARHEVTAAAAAAGMRDRAEDIVLAVDEVLSNSLSHGGGSARMALWSEGHGTLRCEVSDRGEVADALAGRRQPSQSSEGGRGLWIANQLCDLVQIRATPGGTVVRLTWRGGRR